ncbi:MAG: hypothetical protein VXX79_13955 [Pseudomonadota bacterium]|nr:hypothetical protein [Pseudomonadota bacterium]MEC8775938.1 hypothetical protein [Pseudomonadota bacterium]
MDDTPSIIGPRISPTPTSAARPVAPTERRNASTETPAENRPPAPVEAKDPQVVLASGETPLRGSLVDILV